MTRLTYATVAAPKYQKSLMGAWRFWVPRLAGACCFGCPALRVQVLGAHGKNRKKNLKNRDFSFMLQSFSRFDMAWSYSELEGALAR